MIIPSSLAEAHERQQVILEKVADLASSRLRALCRERNWLWDARHKNVESAVAKLEAGSSSCLAGMDDLWAASVIVPTLAEVPAATEALLDIFEGEQKARRSRDVRSFAYDDVHVIATLGSKVAEAVAGREVRERRFEVQVHTGLQYAWWRATHDLYKTARGDWRTQRAASQARASLELLDGVLADLHGAGRLQAEPVPEAEPDDLYPSAWLDLWRPADQPSDLLRFCDTAVALVRACGLGRQEVEEHLRSDQARTFIGQRDLTPGQAVTIVVAQLAGPDFASRLKRAGVRVLVTSEMAQHEPSLEGLSEEVACHP